MAADPGPTSERTEGPTPNGGAYAVAYFRDAASNPVSRDRATQVEIVEHNADDQAIVRTYGTLSPPAAEDDATARVARYLGIRLHQPPESDP